MNCSLVITRRDVGPPACFPVITACLQRTQWLLVVVWFAVVPAVESAFAQTARIPSPTGAAPSATVDPNDRYLEELGKVMDDLGCRIMYVPPLVETTLGPTRGKTGEAAPMPLSEALRRYRQEGRLKFEDFIANSDKTDDTAFGEYDRDQRCVRINTVHRDSLVQNLSTFASSPGAVSRVRRSAYGQAFEAIQTFHHELTHLRQREHELESDPGSPQCESEAYRSTLDLTQGWVQSLQQRLDKEPTLDLAIRLQAACQAWDNYKVGIENAMKDSPTPPDRSALDKPFRDASGKTLTVSDMQKQIGEIREKAEKLETVFRVLGTLQGAGGASGPQADSLKGWEDLAERLDQAGVPLDTKAQLDAFLKQAAQKAAQSQDRSLNVRSPDSIYADIAPTVTRLWQKKQRSEFDKLLTKLRQTPPQARYELDPQDGFRGAGVNRVTITVISSDALPQVIAQLRKRASEIFDPPDIPDISVKDEWTSPEGDTDEETWSDQPSDQDYEVKKPGQYMVKLRRTVSVTGRPPVNFPVLEIKVVVPANMPENVAGRWMGSLVIQQFLVAGKETPAQRCQKIEGAQWRMTMDLKPTSPSGGQMVVDLVPENVPEGVSISRDSLSPGTYTLSGGQFSGTLKIDQYPWPLSGEFRLVNDAWTLGGSGTLSQAINENFQVTLKYSWVVSQVGPVRTK